MVHVFLDMFTDNYNTPPGITGIFRVLGVRSNPRACCLSNPCSVLDEKPWEYSLERLRRHLLSSSHRCLQMKSVDPPLIPSMEHDFLSPTVCAAISCRWCLEKSANWPSSRDNQGKSDQRSPFPSPLRETYRLDFKCATLHWGARSGCICGRNSPRGSFPGLVL